MDNGMPSGGQRDQASAVPAQGQPGAAGPAAAPVLIITKGQPTSEQTAAVVAVLLARAAPAGPAAASPAPRSGWSAKSWQLRRPLPHGPGAWRASALPAGIRQT